MNLHLSHFMVAIFASSVCMLFILFTKKVFAKHISIRWQCNLNLLFFAVLVLPFIPSRLFLSLDFSAIFFVISNWLEALRLEEGVMANASITAGEGTAFAYNIGWLQDFAVPADAPVPVYFTGVIAGLWIIGVITFAVIALISNRYLWLLKESVKPVENKEMLSLFMKCKSEIGVKQNILLGSSILAKAPMTVGFFKLLIILPAEKIPVSDARYAIMHELVHCKNRDVHINFFICLFQVLYWFNPLVYFAFRQMRLDREVACDSAVLDLLPKEMHIDYGGALLNFVNKQSYPSALALSASISGTKPHIIKRINFIASYNADTFLIKAKSYCVFAVMGFFVLSQIPLISVMAGNNDNMYYGFHFDNVIDKDLTSFFEGFEGSFVLYDLNNGVHVIHNRDLSRTRVSPTSTYKIYSALIALNQEVLAVDNTFREWDGRPNPFTAWNRDHDLTSAMHYSVNWYFQNLDLQVGIEQLYYYLTSLSYGNRDLSGGIYEFWIESSLQISPLEQVSILRDFHQNSTIFDARHVDTVREVLRLFERNGAVLSGKTGTGLVNERGVSGWFVGYVEKEDNTFFFATYIRGEDDAGGSSAARITLSILEDMGVYN